MIAITPAYIFKKSIPGYLKVFFIVSCVIISHIYPLLWYKELSVLNYGPIRDKPKYFSQIYVCEEEFWFQESHKTIYPYPSLLFPISSFSFFLFFFLFSFRYLHSPSFASTLAPDPVLSVTLYLRLHHRGSWPCHNAHQWSCASQRPSSPVPSSVPQRPSYGATTAGEKERREGLSPGG